jgi:hypothetical protein
MITVRLSWGGMPALGCPESLAAAGRAGRLCLGIRPGCLFGPADQCIPAKCPIPQLKVFRLNLWLRLFR